jgi:hypothetical protein
MTEPAHFASRPWTQADDDNLRRLALTGFSSTAIGIRMNRTETAVHLRTATGNLEKNQAETAADGLKAKGKMPDPLEGLDTSSLSDTDRVEIEKLRMAYDREGKDGIVKALADLAKNNSMLFRWLLAKFLD